MKCFFISASTAGGSVLALAIMVSTRFETASQSPFSYVFVEIGPRFLFGVTLHDIAVTPDLDLAAIFLARQFAVGVDLRPALVKIMRAEHDIDHVAIFSGEMLALLETTGIHHSRKGLLNRLRLEITLLDLVEAAVKVERFVARPERFHHMQPFGSAVVAIVVLHQR